MICVKIELMSAVNGSTSEIGRMYLANDGDKSVVSKGKLGDYQVAVCRRGTTAIPQPVDPLGPAPTRQGEVKDYPRLANNVWRLITRALLTAFPEEAKTRAKKDEPVLDEAVMRGLRNFASVAEIESQHDVDSDVKAAWNWIMAHQEDVE